MKYITLYEELEDGAYYHCITHDDEDIIVQYHGSYCGNFIFSLGLWEGHIRYVLEKVEDLRERRKKFE